MPAGAEATEALGSAAAEDWAAAAAEALGSEAAGWVAEAGTEAEGWAGKWLPVAMWTR